MLVGFVGGGGEWFLETYQPGLRDIWAPRWNLGDWDRKDRRIWQVCYARIASNAQPQNQTADLSELKVELRHVLGEILRFARSQDFGGFTEAFDSGLARLESQSPFGGLSQSDLAPADFLSLDASQLLCAAEAALVFGGMGSWNDVRVDEAEVSNYKDLSDKLYRLLNRAIVAAANASASGRG